MGFCAWFYPPVCVAFFSSHPLICMRKKHSQATQACFHSCELHLSLATSIIFSMVLIMHSSKGVLNMISSKGFYFCFFKQYPDIPRTNKPTKLVFRVTRGPTDSWGLNYQRTLIITSFLFYAWRMGSIPTAYQNVWMRRARQDTPLVSLSLSKGIISVL